MPSCRRWQSCVTECHQIDKPAVYAIHRILHSFVITFAGNLDSFAQVASANQSENPIALADRQKDSVRRFVDARYDCRVGFQ